MNEYLMRAIDARSIDRLRSEHCQSVLLSFKKASIEKKVNRDTLYLSQEILNNPDLLFSVHLGTRSNAEHLFLL